MRSGGHAWRGRPEMTESPSLAADPRIRLRRALAETTERLSRAGVPSPSADARALIARAARTDRSPLLLDRLPERFAGGPGDEGPGVGAGRRSEEHTSELQSRGHLVCRLPLATQNNYKK